MREFFNEGGFGMYPTAFFGITALLLSVWYAFKPMARLLPLVRGLGAAALLAGVLGTVLGIKATIAGILGSPEIQTDQIGKIALAGLYESSNNLVLALVLTVLVVLAIGVGGFRSREVPIPT
jgi:hypothetical protein